MINKQVLKEYLEEKMLFESVREYLVILNKGLLGNKRVLYSTDSKEKAKEKFLWYRDMYPELRFKMTTKSFFRSMYHRFPEYISDAERQKIFKRKEVEVKYGQDSTRRRFVYSPKDKVSFVKDPHAEKVKIIKQVVYDKQKNSDDYTPTKPNHVVEVQ